jgi:trans-aconitate methyltransferase
MEHILTLDELGRKFGTDKSSQAHNYLAVYEQFLAPYRANADLGVLEIGVRDGPSVRVWQEYFPAAQIVGVDISESCRAHADTRIAIEIGDQSDPKFLQDLVAKYRFDIIFDDGSHTWSHQIDSFRLLFPHLRPGGLFVCEDLQTSRAKFVEKYGKPYTDAAAAYFGRLAAEVAAEGYVYGTMQDAELKQIQNQVEWVRFGRGFVAIKKTD